MKIGEWDDFTTEDTENTENNKHFYLRHSVFSVVGLMGPEHPAVFIETIF